MKKALPKVAIVGRPNVGKSTLFNRLVQRKISIMADEPGVTRDRLFHKTQWLGKEFILVDTGGFSTDMQVDFQREINTQIQIALHEADLVVFLADANGITKEDMLTASMVKKMKKPVIVAVNKADNVDIVNSIDNFYKIGLGKPIAVSSIHGIGIGELLDEVIDKLPKKDYVEDMELTRIGILGKPNVGKSTLTNTLLNSDRVIVSEVSGTTRDAIDTKIHWNGIDYVLTDTAGIKKNKKSLNDIEWYAELRSKLTIHNSDIALLILDATQGITHVDNNIMEALVEEKKPTIIIMNKTDILPMERRVEFEQEVRDKFKYASWAPVVFISAMNKKGIAKIFDVVEAIEERLKTSISKAHLHEFLIDIQMLKKAPRHNGIEVKLKYMAYENKGIPTFVIFANRPELVHFSYKRFIENQIRLLFNFEGIPVQFKYKKG